MSEVLAEFKFQNLEFELIKEVMNEVYINVDRAVRVDPYPGMKQPTPSGGLLGLETILEVKHNGEPASNYNWELYKEHRLVQTGSTDDDGMTNGLDVPLPIEESCSMQLIILRPRHASRY